jgi:hypothetical protein
MNDLKFPSSFSFFVPFMNEYFELKDKMEERKQEIIKEWHETKKLPRKLKKKRRKELELDWQIANIDLFEF